MTSPRARIIAGNLDLEIEVLKTRFMFDVFCKAAVARPGGWYWRVYRDADKFGCVASGSARTFDSGYRQCLRAAQKLAKKYAAKRHSTS